MLPIRPRQSNVACGCRPCIPQDELVSPFAFLKYRTEIGPPAISLIFCESLVLKGCQACLLLLQLKLAFSEPVPTDKCNRRNDGRKYRYQQ